MMYSSSGKCGSCMRSCCTRSTINVRSGERFFDASNAADMWGEPCEFARDPHGRAAESDAAAKFAQQMNVRAGDPAVQNIAEDGDIQIFERAEPVANGERVEQRLRGMLVRAIAGVDYGNIQGRATKSAAPEAAWRITMQSGFMARGYEPCREATRLFSDWRIRPEDSWCPRRAGRRQWRN